MNLMDLPLWECQACKTGYVRGMMNVASADRCCLCTAYRKKPIPDCEFWDATEFAHPAWWRGSDCGTLMAAQRIQDVLDGKDTGAGVIASKELEAVRRAVLALMKKVN